MQRVRRLLVVLLLGCASQSTEADTSTPAVEDTATTQEDVPETVEVQAAPAPDVPDITEPDVAAAEDAVIPEDTAEPLEADVPDVPECVPDCEGRECGADGCGGACGKCLASTDCLAVTCEEGQCTGEELTGPCDDGDECTTDEQCVGSVCVGQPPADPQEGFSSFPGPKLESVGECAEPGDLDTVLGTLFPNGDVDWFHYSELDTFMCEIDPTVTFIPAPGVDLRPCVYFKCNVGPSVEVTCMEGSELATGPTPDIIGCCSTVKGPLNKTVDMEALCGESVLGSGTVYIEVKHVGATTCKPYQVLHGG